MPDPVRPITQCGPHFNATLFRHAFPACDRFWYLRSALGQRLHTTEARYLCYIYDSELFRVSGLEHVPWQMESDRLFLNLKKAASTLQALLLLHEAQTTT